jgi:hypothetical protein
LVHEHVIELIKYKACMNEVEDGDGGGWQNCKKKKTITPLAIIDFFGGGIGYKKKWSCTTKVHRGFGSIHCQGLWSLV